MKTMFPDSSKKHGFTLVELVLTITILGILAAVSLPKFFDQGTFDERFFHDDLISAARYAQRLSTGSGCAVRLSVSGAGFSMVQDNNCNLSSPSYTLTVNRPSDSEVFSNAEVPSGLTINSSKAEYYFLPSGEVVDGTGTSVGDATISLDSLTTTNRTINIVGDTGYVY
ncbi:MAG: prepilin-type N-terminal cleavage/methylation domain-containing protein [Gammaproteobacteria bacterium]|nr:prepilin-type N-terminal cleavage/methylation domain-containing protein [Gammaproteobacteria bacterium]